MRWWADIKIKKKVVHMNISIIISIFSVLVAFFFGLMTFLFNAKNSKRTDTKDLVEQIKDSTKVNLMLESISKTTQAIERKMDAMCEELKSHNERLIKVEESCKAAHHRLDTLEERINKEDD